MSKFTFGTPTTTANTPGFGFNTQTTPTVAGFGSGNTTFGTLALPTAGAGQVQQIAQTTPGLNFSFGGAPTAAGQTTQPNTLTLGGGATITAIAGGNLFSSNTSQTQPSQLGQPGQFGQTGQLSQPGQLGQTGQLGQLGQPGQLGLGQPGQLGQLGQPGQLGQLGQPGQLGQLGQPGQLGQLGQTGQFGQLGQPGQLGQLGQPGQLGQVGQAGQLGQLSQPNPLAQAGQLAQQTQSTGLTFGAPAAKKAGHTLGVGLTTGGGLTTGTLATGGGLTGGLTFGAPTTTAGLSFGTATTTTGGLSFGTPSTSGGLTFGTSATALAPASSTLSFGASPATTTTSSLFGTNTTGLFGAKPTTTIDLTTTSAATPVSRGLGGLDVSVSKKGLTQDSTSPTAAKENSLPNELMQKIDSFKEFVKTQKVLSSDIARGSARTLNRCSEDTASLMEILTTLAGSVQRDKSLADKLKQDTAKALQNAEIAQRTHDTPAGLQYENNAPLLFFMELAENFEHDLLLFKSQIETTEKHIQTMMSPKTLTPQELTMAMSKLHESLVAVAGRLQGVHSKVQQQKEQYLNFRKYVLKDSSNVFEDINSTGKSNKSSIGKVTSGPTPFSPGHRSFLSNTALHSSQTPSYGSTNPLGKN